MPSDTIAFGVPLVGLLVGTAILVGSLFVAGLSVVSVAGGAIGLASIAALGYAVARSTDDTPTVDLVEREREHDDDLDRTHGVK